MDKKLSFWSKLKAYRLKNNVLVIIFISIVFILSLVVYMLPGVSENAVISNLALAIFTSLLATIFAMLAEVYVSYKKFENDQFLEDIHTFGIANLNKNKETLLRDMLVDCDRWIWISGYRLILTDHIKSDIAAAIRRGAKVTALLCPPWAIGFQLVYGEQEKVMDNYFNVLHSIKEAMKTYEGFDIFFVDKPLFSDTYRIDQQLVTGPYMHNKDPEYNRIMAKDFFSYNLVRKSKLYEIIDNEYRTLCEEAKLKLDWDKFEASYNTLKAGDYRESEKRELLLSACVEVTDSVKWLDME